MVEEGRITPNESAELLDALGSRPDAEARDRRHWLYIRIVAPDGAVRLHAVVRFGLIRFAERFFYSRVLKAAHADLQKSLPWAMSAQPGETLQIPLESGEHVQISVEDSPPDFRPAPTPEPPAAKDEGPELEILSALERGEIDVEEALRRLEEQRS